MKDSLILIGVCIAAVILIQLSLFVNNGGSLPLPGLGKPTATIDAASLLKTEGNKVISGTAQNTDTVHVQVALRFKNGDTHSAYGREVPVVDGRWSITVDENKLSCNEYEVSVSVDVPGTPHQVKRIAEGKFQGSCSYILSR